MAKISNVLVSAHILVECYALWLSGTGSGVEDSALRNQFGIVCSPSALRRVYPSSPSSPHSPHLAFPAIITLLVLIFGGMIRLSAMRHLGKMYTWETSFLRDEHRLITSGPYRFVRHPGYTGLAAACGGYIGFCFSPGTVGRECLWGSNGRTLLLLYPVLLSVFFFDTVTFAIRRSWEEDALMKKEFGKEWEEWRARVKWRVLPYVL